MNNSLLVMQPSPAGAPPAWLRRLFPHNTLLNESAAREYSAVVVINDHSAESVQLLQRALELRAERPELQVTVLTHVADHDEGLGALIGGMAGPGPIRALPQNQIMAAVRGSSRMVETQLRRDAVSFEYEV